jgi:polyphosphate kinase
VDEDEVKNLRQALKGELLGRQFGASVRLEVAKNCPPELSQFLLDQFGLHQSRLYAVNGPVNLVRLTEIMDHVDDPKLRFAPFFPGIAQKPGSPDIFAALREGDILLHHPFQSFQTVIDFIRSAAVDPHVVAIKQTIYRTGMNSDLMDALIVAARQGKEVTVIVELKARFDEEANINWADKLEQAGAQVVYGVVGLKTHAKVALVIRREENKLRYYAHLGTGNYHPTTTKFYTDFGLLTCAPRHRPGSQRGVHPPDQPDQAAQASPPVAGAVRAAERDHQGDPQRSTDRRAGRPGRIIVKINALVDESVIRALVRGVARRRQDRLDRARRLHAQAGRAGPVGKHQGPLDHRPLPRAQPHLLFPQRFGARCDAGQCRLDEPQPVPPHRSGLPHPGQGPEAAGAGRRLESVLERQSERLGTGTGRPLPAPQGARKQAGFSAQQHLMDTLGTPHGHLGES